MATLSRWLDEIPDDLWRGSPDVILLQAWRLTLERRLDEAGQLRDRLRELDLTVDQRAQFSAIEVTLARLSNDLEAAVELGERALADANLHDDFARSIILVHLGTAYRMQERLRRAIELLTQGVELADEIGNTMGWVVASSQLAVAQMTVGDLVEAERTYRAVMDYEAQLGLKNLGLGIASHLGLAEVLREWNQLDEASDLVTGALEILARIGDRGETGTTLYGYIVLARTYQGRGELNRALAQTDEALRLAITHGLSDWQLERVEAVRARQLLELGRLDEAVAWVDSRGYSHEAQPDYHHDYLYQVVARILIEQERYQVAEHLLSTLMDLAETGERRRRLIEVGVLLALLERRRGNDSAAIDHLRTAISHAEKDRFVRVFADEARDLAGLLPRVQPVTGGGYPSADYLALLADAMGTGGPQAPDQSALIEPLSERELEVLALLAEGLTNRELAERLYLSVGTIKRHTHNIYGKLGVNNRTQALVRGRALGLID